MPSVIYTSGFQHNANIGSEVSWANEKMVMNDPVERCRSYEMLENNAKDKPCVATIKGSPIFSGDIQHGARLSGHSVLILII